jgi:hypothetical protein
LKEPKVMMGSMLPVRPNQKGRCLEYHCPRNQILRSQYLLNHFLKCQCLLNHFLKSQCLLNHFLKSQCLLNHFLKNHPL